MLTCITRKNHRASAACSCNNWCIWRPPIWPAPHPPRRPHRRPVSPLIRKLQSSLADGNPALSMFHDLLTLRREDNDAPVLICEDLFNQLAQDKLLPVPAPPPKKRTRVG